MYTVDTAPMPELVAMPANPPSSSAICRSSAEMVGFPSRV